MKMQRFCFSRGRNRPLSFLEKPRHGDVQALQRQMQGRKFSPELVLAVSRRCAFGFPQAVLCQPLRNGKPFPTTFWLTCPYLVHACGCFESAGGVAMLENGLKGRHDAWAAYNLLHSLLRISLVPELLRKWYRKYFPGIWRALCRGGVGGIEYRNGGGVKCIHLQAASLLSLGAHPCGDLLQEMLGPRECSRPEQFGCAMD